MWTVSKCFEGRTVAVLASGPSMNQESADLVRDAGLPAVVINSTFRLAPWAWALFGADSAWWKHEDNRDAHQFAGLKVSVEDCKGVLKLHYTGTTGFDPDPSCLRSGGNSGYQGVHLLAHTGAARILLLGFDMGGEHWHDDHPAPLRKTPQEHYPGWIARFEELKKALDKRGIDVINCTPGSALKCFPMAELADVLETANEGN